LSVIPATYDQGGMMDKNSQTEQVEIIKNQIDQALK